MRFTFLLTLLLPLLLVARENPFTPVEIIKTDESIEKTAVDDYKTVATEPAKEIVAPDAFEPESQREDAADIVTGDSDEEVVNYEKVRFVFKENSVYIETKDKVLKHFKIANPPRIVIDFESESNFASKRQELITRPFKKLEMGAHGDQYRVVLRLDRAHTYTLEKSMYGHLLRIKE